MQKVRFNGAVAAFDILIDDNIDSQNQSADIEPPVFDSQTPLSDKRIFQEIASNDYNNSSETDSSSNANVSPSNTEKKELLVPLEVETMTILASMLENEAFDTGISNASEK